MSQIREAIQTTPVDLPWTSVTKNNFSSHKQLLRMSQQNEALNGKNNPDKIQNNG